MPCEWGRIDCSNENKKCMLCVTDSLYYSQIKRKNIGFGNKIKIKETSRQGSISEVKAYNQFKNAIDNNSVTGTPNSGAGKVKGDMQVVGIVNAMLELKTTTVKNAHKARGKESFTIKREWLDKLKREAKEANKEIYSLLFSFKEFDDDFYAVIEMEHLMDIIATLKQDRLAVKNVDRQIDVYKKKSALIEAENVKLLAEIDYLKAQLKSQEEVKEL